MLFINKAYRTFCKHLKYFVDKCLCVKGGNSFHAYNRYPLSTHSILDIVEGLGRNKERKKTKTSLSSWVFILENGFMRLCEF